MPVKKKVTKKTPKIKFPEQKKPGYLVAGFDVSMSSIAGAAIAYDNVTKKFKGPAFVMERWSKEDDYFSRLKSAAKSHEFIFELQNQLALSLPLENIFIAQEEPFPAHGNFMRKGISGFLKQQAEISGAFLGGLLRYGYGELWQMSNQTWRTMIAADLEITTHHSKWRSPELAIKYNCRPVDSGKFRAKQWAMNPGYAWQGLFDEIPDWPDIIESGKYGKIPRPDGSKAKAVQPDDRYDALAVMWALYLDLEERGQLKSLVT